VVIVDVLTLVVVEDVVDDVVVDVVVDVVDDVVVDDVVDVVHVFVVQTGTPFGSHTHVLQSTV